MSEQSVVERNPFSDFIATLNQDSATSLYNPVNLPIPFFYDDTIIAPGALLDDLPVQPWARFHVFPLQIDYTPSYPDPELPLASRLLEDAERLIDCDLSSAPIEHQVLQANLRYALGPYVVVDGEWCSWWEDEDLGVVVQRKPWSLLGSGSTLRDAINNFRENAARHAVGMQHDRFDDVTEDAWEMRGFVIRYLSDDV